MPHTCIIISTSSLVIFENFIWEVFIFLLKNVSVCFFSQKIKVVFYVVFKSQGHLGTSLQQLFTLCLKKPFILFQVYNKHNMQQC